MIDLVLNYVLEKLELFEALIGQNLLVELLDVGIVVVLLVLAILVELCPQVLIISLVAIFERLQHFTLKLVVHADLTQLQIVYFLDERLIDPIVLVCDDVVIVNQLENFFSQILVAHQLRDVFETQELRE